ncbi:MULTISPECIES: nucleotidyltransferase domain-containing protein [Methanobacterium]|uniref:protein adenylyltransferase n=1 Tax=Methanobacterium veterum TaxID=408577 RepID=A0A9E4ZYE5_9EURY|nr:MULTISPECIES: nucleotidyltransferase domain-containing protein [Methanobacterium]MCZ3366396.1 nucleotidyltransferase domain-containing protein [Methanobacterium veterum]MCZ3371904.1 nucleotidyltransferase domain-containing protein [Methanobacterium veterum]
MKDNTIKVIIGLLNNGCNKTNIKQLSQDINMNYSNVYRIVKRLHKTKLVSLKKYGGAYECLLLKKVNPLIFHAEYLRCKDLLKKNKDLKIIHLKLNSLKFPFISLIFGSYAKGTTSKLSDIDLMIISEKGREKEFEKIVNLLPLDIHLITLNFDDFLSMAKNSDFSVVSEALKSNIILFGIEDYYRVLENVGC